MSFWDDLGDVVTLGQGSKINEKLNKGTTDAAQQFAKDYKEGIAGSGYGRQTSDYGNDVNAYRQAADQWAGGVNPAYDMSQANAYRAQADAARGQQSQALGLMRAAAEGAAPSQALAQMHTGQDAAMAAQLAGMGGARGAYGLAQAQQMGAGNAGAQQFQAANAMAQARAQEMAQARGAYGQGALSLRDMDAMAQRNAADRQMQVNAQGLQAAGLRQSGQLGFEAMGQDIKSADMAGRLAKMQEYQRAKEAYDQRKLNQDAANRQLAGTALQVGGTALGLVAGGPAGAVAGGAAGSAAAQAVR